MDTLPIELAQEIYKMSCRDLFEDIPIEAHKFRLRGAPKYQFFRDFHWATLGTSDPVSLADLLIKNSHLYRFLKFQKLLKLVYKKVSEPFLKTKLKEFFYAGPFPMAFFPVQHIDPMPVQGHLRAPQSFMCDHFGEGDHWNIVFQDSTLAIIKLSSELGKWEIQGETENALDAVLEVIKF